MSGHNRWLVVYLCHNWWQSLSQSHNRWLIIYLIVATGGKIPHQVTTGGLSVIFPSRNRWLVIYMSVTTGGSVFIFPPQLVATSFIKSQQMARHLSSSSHNRWLLSYPLSQLVALSFLNRNRWFVNYPSKSQQVVCQVTTVVCQLSVQVATGGLSFIFPSQLVAPSLVFPSQLVALSLPFQVATGGLSSSSRNWWLIVFRCHNWWHYLYLSVATGGRALRLFYP